jgi:hypothetical protein
VGEEEKFAMRHVWAAFKDWQVCTSSKNKSCMNDLADVEIQVWFHILIYISIVPPCEYFRFLITSIVIDSGLVFGITIFLP